MTGKFRLIAALSLCVAALLIQICPAKGNGKSARRIKFETHKCIPLAKNDTVPPADVMDVVTIVISATNSFNIESVANLYTPNAVISDDEPPYSWNGPTAGIQWVNAIEKVCKDNKLTKLKASIEPINVFQASADNVYIVVPVSYSGSLPGRHFAVKGAFTFVLRQVNGKWLIKSQAWMQAKGLNGRG